MGVSRCGTSSGAWNLFPQKLKALKKIARIVESVALWKDISLFVHVKTKCCKISASSLHRRQRLCMWACPYLVWAMSIGFSGCAACKHLLISDHWTLCSACGWSPREEWTFQQREGVWDGQLTPVRFPGYSSVYMWNTYLLRRSTVRHLPDLDEELTRSTTRTHASRPSVGVCLERLASCCDVRRTSIVRRFYRRRFAGSQRPARRLAPAGTCAVARCPLRGSGRRCNEWRCRPPPPSIAVDSSANSRR